jgi:hypothetical protein
MADSQVHIIAVVKAIRDNRPNRLCNTRQSLMVAIMTDDGWYILLAVGSLRAFAIWHLQTYVSGQ